MVDESFGARLGDILESCISLGSLQYAFQLINKTAMLGAMTVQ